MKCRRRHRPAEGTGARVDDDHVAWGMASHVRGDVIGRCLMGVGPEHDGAGLYKVALRKAWALGRRRHREQPMGGLNGVDEDSLEPLDLDSDVADVVAERIEHASMREVLGRLHWRERRELALFAYGLSYEEIATVTGASYTAVNRWIARGRKALRNDRAYRELGRDQDWLAR